MKPESTQPSERPFEASLLPPPGPIPGAPSGVPAEAASEAAAEPASAMPSGPPSSPPPAGAKPLTSEDFALLSRVPARKPETLDNDAIKRAAWMVGSLALGLWFVTLFAKPNAPVKPVVTAPPPEGAMMQEAPPIVLPGNAPAPVPRTHVETPEPPLYQEPPSFQAPPGFQGTPRDRAPIGQADLGYPDQPAFAPPAPEAHGLPAEGDVPDPSNLFPE